MSVTETVKAIQAHDDASRSGRIVELGPAAGVTCQTCPWRLENMARPPLDKPRPTPAEYYTREGRDRMWEGPRGDGHGIRAGGRGCCHKRSAVERGHYCAGVDVVLHRELLRWWEAGASHDSFGSLGGLDAVRLILSASVLCTPYGLDDRGCLVTPGLSMVGSAGGSVVPHLDGVALTLAAVAQILHPEVVNPEVGYDALPAVSADELARWADLRVGAGWRDGPAQTVFTYRG